MMSNQNLGKKEEEEKEDPKLQEFGDDFGGESVT